MNVLLGAVLQGDEKGNFVLKNILTASNTEAKDGGVGHPARGGEITARSRSPDGRKFREGGRRGGLEKNMLLGAMWAGRRSGCVVLCVPARSGKKVLTSTQLS
jgi:hypothetical protein